MRVLGVDPGLSGALAMIETSLDQLLVWDMPVVLSGTGSRKEVSSALLADQIRPMAPDFCCIERVHAMPKQGVSSVFSFGHSYGAVLGVLGALKVPVHHVAPGVWKRALGLDQDKAGARAMAVRLFPNECHYFARVKDHDRAEAALLAWYGLRQLSPRKNNMEERLGA